MNRFASLSFIDHRTFTALVAGFAAFASVVAFSSASAAFLSWISEEQASDTANAAAVGLATGFPLATVLAMLAILDSLVRG